MSAISSPRRGRVRRLLESYAIPALLVLVALRQTFLAHERGLSPWKGGGFGMFASLDRNETRLIRCYLKTGSGDVAIRLPRTGRVSRLASRVRSMPTRERLDALAAEIERSLAGETAPPGRPAPSGMRLEVRKMRFRSDVHRLDADLLAYVDRPAH